MALLYGQSRSNLLGQVFGAQFLEVLDGHSPVAIAVQDLQVALDVGPRGWEDAVEGFVGVNNHGYNLYAIDHSILISVVGVYNSPGDLPRAIPIREARVDKDGAGIQTRALVAGVVRPGLIVGGKIAHLNWLIDINNNFNVAGACLFRIRLPKSPDIRSFPSLANLFSFISISMSITALFSLFAFSNFLLMFVPRHFLRFPSPCFLICVDIIMLTFYGHNLI